MKAEPNDPETEANLSSGRFPHTDLGNAMRFVSEDGGDLRYLGDKKDWLIWTGTHWEPDESGVLRCVHRMVQGLMTAAKLEADREYAKYLRAHAKSSQSARAIAAIEKLARVHADVSIKRKDLDRDPWILNVLNGTLDLRTGELREHRRSDLITRVAPVLHDRSAQCPRWLQFLEEVLPDAEIRAYIRRFIGLCLTGVVKEHCLPIFWGESAGNGKSTFVKAIRFMLGPYVVAIPKDALVASKTGPRHPTELTLLDGARLAIATETNQGDEFDQAQVKLITGGDSITARRMHKDFYEWEPTHKALLIVNPKPRIRGNDAGLKRRVHLVPWEAKFTDGDIDELAAGAKLADTGLDEKFEAEASGILNWALAGCSEWQRIGLAPPEAVRVATKEYFEDEDFLGAFFNDCCEFNPDGRITRQHLYKVYTRWARDLEQKPVSLRTFSEAVRSKLREVHGRNWKTDGKTRDDPKKPRDAWNGISADIAIKAEGAVYVLRNDLMPRPSQPRPPGARPGRA